MYICKYCSKVCKNPNSLRNHERLCKENPNRSLPGVVKAYMNGWDPAWNRGLTKDTDERVKKNAESIKNWSKIYGGSFTGKHHTNETKHKLSVSQLKHNHENQKRHSWAKMGWYDNIWMMSTYELAYYIYMKDQGKNIVRCYDRFSYEWENKLHNYTPDFIVDGTYVELKGYETQKDKAKYLAVEKLEVLYYKDIKPMIDYVKQMFNVDKLELLYVSP